MALTLAGCLYQPTFVPNETLCEPGSRRCPGPLMCGPEGKCVLPDALIDSVADEKGERDAPPIPDAAIDAASIEAPAPPDAAAPDVAAPDLTPAAPDRTPPDLAPDGPSCAPVDPRCPVDGGTFCKSLNTLLTCSFDERRCLIGKDTECDGGTPCQGDPPGCRCISNAQCITEGTVVCVTGDLIHYGVCVREDVCLLLKGVLPCPGGTRCEGVPPTAGCVP
jgi:hypothetical protein